MPTGAGRISWDSADCTRGEPNRVATFRRGVPVQESFTWNRSISLPGCVTVASSARDGSYQVQARGASVASPVRTLKLAAKRLRIGAQDGGERLADIFHLLYLHQVGKAVGALQGRS